MIWQEQVDTIVMLTECTEVIRVITVYKLFEQIYFAVHASINAFFI